MDLGTLFGVAGFVIALISLVYVRTQAEASRVQAEATLEQGRIARRLAALEVNLGLADRACDVRRALVEEPTVVDAFLRANPLLEEVAPCRAPKVMREGFRPAPPLGPAIS